MKNLITIFISIFVLQCNAQTWHIVNNSAPHYLGSDMALLNDGSVIIKNVNGGFPGYDGRGWNKLTPDSTGNYINGTWSTIASMNYDKLYFGTITRSDGRVITGKGYYFTDSNIVEEYNPSTNSWSYHSDTTVQNGLYPITNSPVTGLIEMQDAYVSLPTGHVLSIYTPQLIPSWPYYKSQSYFYLDSTLIAPPIGVSYAPFWPFSCRMLLLPNGGVMLLMGACLHPYIYE